MEKRMRKIWNNKKLENTDQPKKTKKLFGKKNDTKKAKTEVKTDIQEYEDIGETKRAVWESKTEKEDSEVIEESETEKENKEKSFFNLPHPMEEMLSQERFLPKMMSPP